MRQSGNAASLGLTAAGVLLMLVLLSIAPAGALARRTFKPRIGFAMGSC